MGYARRKPERLADKLRQVRMTFGLSQTELLARLDAEEMIAYNQISRYETGDREPPLEILLRYARLAGVNMEVFVDDELVLPERLPGPTSHEEIKRAFTSSPKRKR
jgi:transcriptional regulator with XRE-family HTH domain